MTLDILLEMVSSRMFSTVHDLKSRFEYVSSNT